MPYLIWSLLVPRARLWALISITSLLAERFLFLVGDASEDDSVSRAVSSVSTISIVISQQI